MNMKSESKFIFDLSERNQMVLLRQWATINSIKNVQNLRSYTCCMPRSCRIFKRFHLVKFSNKKTAKNELPKCNRFWLYCFRDNTKKQQKMNTFECRLEKALYNVFLLDNSRNWKKARKFNRFDFVCWEFACQINC